MKALHSTLEFFLSWKRIMSVALNTMRSNPIFHFLIKRNFWFGYYLGVLAIVGVVLVGSVYYREKISDLFASAEWARFTTWTLSRMIFGELVFGVMASALTALAVRKARASRHLSDWKLTAYSHTEIATSIVLYSWCYTLPAILLWSIIDTIFLFVGFDVFFEWTAQWQWLPIIWMFVVPLAFTVNHLLSAWWAAAHLSARTLAPSVKGWWRSGGFLPFFIQLLFINAFSLAVGWFMAWFIGGYVIGPTRAEVPETDIHASWMGYYCLRWDTAATWAFFFMLTPIFLKTWRIESCLEHAGKVFQMEGIEEPRATEAYSITET